MQILIPCYGNLHEAQGLTMTGRAFQKHFLVHPYLPYRMSGSRGTQSGIGLTSNESFTSFSCARNCGGRTQVAIPEK